MKCNADKLHFLLHRHVSASPQKTYGAIWGRGISRV